MSNLTEKIDELQLQLLNQHGQIMEALGIVASALAGLALNTPDYSTIVDAIEAQTAVLEDVHLDTISIDQKLLTIRENVEGLITNTNDLKTITGAQAEDVSLMQVTMGVKAEGAEFTLASLTRALSTGVGNMVTSIGMLPEPAEGTVLNLLADANVIAGDCCSDGSPNANECDEEFESEGMLVLPWAVIGGTSQMFAVFDEPAPAGLTFGTTFGLGADYTELVSSDWGQWWVYVTSGEATYSDGADGFTRYPTGVWRLMSGSGSRAFSVDARGSITVTLCPNSQYNPGGVVPPERACCGYSEGTGELLSVLFPSEYVSRFQVDGHVLVYLMNGADGATVVFSRGETELQRYTLSATYQEYCFGSAGDGEIIVTNIGPGNVDFRSRVCP